MVVKRSNAENLDNYMIIDHSENIGISLICQFTPVEMVYYDDYAFHDSLSTAERQKYLKQDIIGADEIGPLLIGQPTGGKRALSDGSDKMLLYVNYYDRLGRVVQTCEDNILGKVDYNGTTYSLTDMPVTTEKFFNHSSSSLSHLVYTNTYDADGRKLRVSHYGSRGEKRDELDYIGDMVLRNGALERTLTPNGYIVNDTVYYYVKDYQGNVRSVVREDGAVVESNEYYPYGGLFSATTSAQPYKYGSKELDRTHGLDWYDFSARMHDAMLTRWGTIDPFAEKYYTFSPYIYCAANPIRFTDPDGRWILGNNGKRVSYTKSRGFSKNVPEDVKKLGNAMIKVTKGESVLLNMINSAHEIKIIINNELPQKDVKGNLIIGKTSPMINRKTNDFGSVTITIYNEVLSSEAIKNDPRYQGLTTDEILGANGVHEGTHATSKEASSSFNKSDGENSAEANALKEEQEYLNQLRKSKENGL